MELTTYFLKHNEPQFVFGSLTIIDFYYLQGVRQTLALFSCIDDQVATNRWAEVAKAYLLYK
jgi:hypothetical protein